MIAFTKPYTILVDMDGVLVWWEKHFLAEMKRRYPHIKVWEFGQRTEADQPLVDKMFYLPEVQSVLRTPGFYSQLEPIEGSKQALEEMKASGLDVAICTSPALRNPTCASDKYDSIKRLYGKSWADEVIIAKKKYRVNGDILIDDKAFVSREADATWTHVRFDQSYNRGDMSRLRITGWNNWESAVQLALESREAA